METFKKLIKAKLEEIEEYPIDTQENEELYIHQINVLQEAGHILFGHVIFINEES